MEDTQPFDDSPVPSIKQKMGEPINLQIEQIHLKFNTKVPD